MENKSSVCNVVPSPFDPRDWAFEGRITSSLRSDFQFPETFVCPNLPAVKDQGQRGTCVAMSLSCVKEYQEWADNPEMKGELMSPNSVYIHRSSGGEGMNCRNAMDILLKKGICTERLFPYSKKEEPTKIPKDAEKEAMHYRIKSYARVTTIHGLKEALVEYGPVLIAFPYYNNGSPEFWHKPTINAKLDGGHAVAVVGWNEAGFILRNSWGEKWNGDGHVLYSYSDWGLHWEIWSCIDENTDYIPDHLKYLPEEKKSLLLRFLLMCK